MPDGDELLAQRAEFTKQLREKPYSARLYVQRAQVYQALNYHDLAVGDAYRGLSLTDKAVDDAGEYHEEARRALLNVASHDQQQHDPRLGFDHAEEDNDHEGQLAIFVEQLARDCYSIIAHSLLQCGCLQDALQYAERGLRTSPHDSELKERRQEILGKAREVLGSETPKIEDLSAHGLARRALYPWNKHEPDRFSADSLAELNAAVEQVAPKCEVRAIDLPALSTSPYPPSSTTIKQLGVFATAAIEPGEVVLHERTALVANNQLHGTLCDACSGELPGLDSPETDLVVACEDCEDTYFCNESCARLAHQTYHPAVCDKQLDTFGRELPKRETTHALYLLLLQRAFAMAQTQDMHPLDLPEVKFIWGDFTSVSAPPALPFSLAYNVIQPLHALEKMGIDIYASLARFDTWVINTLYAKFRGTASARVSTSSGAPEVCAVHPLWCLANHSCDPNVAWDWSAEMVFTARETRKREDARPGLRPGDQVLGHYCDIDLPVQERREWAAGSLGGWCMCERCLREQEAEPA